MRTASANVTCCVIREFWVAHASRVLANPSRPRGLCARLVLARGGRVRGKIVWARRRNQHARRVRYPIGLADSAATCSCNAGSLSRWRKYCTICSTNAASGRGKINKYFGPFPTAGKITRFSDKNLGSCVTVEPSRSIVRAKGRPFLRATNKSLRGSSFVATSAPERFGGMRLPRPLMHGAAQAIVSPRTFSRLKTDASRGGKASGSFIGTLRSAGPFNFFQASQIFAFIARKILGAK
jgi:hypothetical protein